MRLVVRLSYVFVTIKKAMTDFRGLASIQAFTKKKCAQETRNHARISRFFIPRPPPSADRFVPTSMIESWRSIFEMDFSFDGMDLI